MRPTLYIILLLSYLTSVVQAQTKLKVMPIPKKVTGVNENCYYQSKYSDKQRLTFYPFNISDSVVLVSFRHQSGNYPIKDHSVVADSLLEVKHLNKQNVNQFTDILFNHFYIRRDNIGAVAQCFLPRNAILFFKDKVLKESILVCFHCSKYEVNSGKYGLFGEECYQKLDMIRNFFITHGVTFGTDMDVDSYPGETFKDEGIIAPPTKL